MSKPTVVALLLAIYVGLMALPILPVSALVPFTRALWDPFDDPFRILEQTPLPLPRAPSTNLEGALALARADWKETENAHIITLDLPGMKKDDLKIEVEENRVLRVSGERKAVEEERENEKWHRIERVSGKFWRQFRMPLNADLERVSANLEDGVLRIVVPKLAEEKKRQSKVIDIAASKGSEGEQVVKATKAEM